MDASSEPPRRPPPEPEGEPAAADREQSEAERVRELRARIAAGEYRVDPEALARRILDSGDLEGAARGPRPATADDSRATDDGARISPIREQPRLDAPGDEGGRGGDEHDAERDLEGDDDRGA